MSEIIICFIFFILIIVYCNYRIIRLERIFIKSEKLQNVINKTAIESLTQAAKASMQYETIANNLHQRITDLEKNKLMNYGSRN